MPHRDHDEPFYVPVEFERDHLIEAQRTVARSAHAHRPHRRMLAAANRPATPRSRARRVAVAIHLFAAILLVTLAAITESWPVAGALLAVVGVSLLIVLRLLAAAHPAEITEPQH